MTSTDPAGLPPEARPAADRVPLEVHAWLVAAVAAAMSGSRTAGGIFDGGVSADKPSLTVKDGDALARGVAANTTRAARLVWAGRHLPMRSVADLRTFVEALADTVNAGLLPPGTDRYRQHEGGPDFRYVPAAAIPGALDDFYEALQRRVDDDDAVATAAWVEQEFDPHLHPFADGQGRTTKLLSAWVLARHGLPPPIYPARAEYYTAIRLPLDQWTAHYRTFVRDAQHRPAARSVSPMTTEGPGTVARTPGRASSGHDRHGQGRDVIASGLRVVFRKVDLDTCATAVVLGIGAEIRAEWAPGGATDRDLLDQAVVCIEAGGSGQTDLNDFDHHGSGAPAAAACEQALACREADAGDDRPLRRLVEYVAAVDLVRPLPDIAFPSLSSVFSGMRLVEPDQVRQFTDGVELLRRVLALELDPFASMPARPEWAAWIERKRQEHAGLLADLDHVLRFRTASGRHAGFVETDRVGALGALYALGCDVGIARRPLAAGEDGRRWQYTVGGRDGFRVDSVLAGLNAREPGWGGPSHGTIVGAPPGGSALALEEVLAAVEAAL